MFVSVPPNATLQQMCDAGIEARALDREWEGAIQCFVGDAEIPRALWAKARPKPGAIVAFRARAADPGTLTAIVAFAWNVVQQVALAFVANAIMSAFAPDTDVEAAGQLYTIDASRNEIAKYRPVPCILGTMRVFPPLAAKPYTRAIDDKIFLYLPLCLGLGPLTIDAGSIKIGDTLASSFQGFEYQTKLSPSDPNPTIIPYQADEQEGPGLLELADGWVVRETDSSQCDELEVEITFHEGLGRFSSSGEWKTQSAAWALGYRLVGATDWLKWDGSPDPTNVGTVTSLFMQERKPFRRTPNTSVARGKYEVRMKRVSADPVNQNDKNGFLWSALRTFTHEPPVTDPNLALLFVKVEAGDQLNGVIDQLNVIATRVAPKWDDEAEEFGAAGPTRNAAELTRWIATGPGVARPRTSGEIDEAAFGAWAELCAANSWFCDFEIRAGMRLDEAMALAARCGRATLGTRAGKLTPILDDMQPVATQLFTPRNCWGFRAQRRYPPKTHAYRLEFSNEEKNYVTDEMVVYFPGYDFESAELIETRPVPGKTSPLAVAREGYRIIAEALIRGEDYIFNADIEGLTCARGKRIAVSHYVVAVGRRSGRVAALILNEAETHVVAIELDEVIEQTLGEDYAIEWRRVSDDDISVQSLGVETTNGASNIVQLAAEGGVPVSAAPKVNDLVTFGDAGIATLDLFITNIARSAAFEAEISAMAYSDDLYAGDDAPEPVWSSNISGEAFPAPPAPIIKGVAAHPNAIYVDFDFPLGTAARVRSIVTYWKRTSDVDRFELVATLPAEARLASYPPGDVGETATLVIVAVGDRGRRAASAEVSVVSLAYGSVLAGFLTNESHTVATAADGSGGSYATAGGAFKVFRGDIDISDGTDDDIGTTYEVVAGSVTSGLSISINAETGVYSISNLTVDQAVATLRATNGSFSIDRVYTISKSKAGAAGSNGANAQTIRLSATSQQFTFDPDNNANPSSQSITLSIDRQNIPSGTVSWSASPSVTLTGSGDSRALSVANFGSNTTVEITATLGSLVEKMTIVRTRAGGNLFTLTRSSNMSLTGRTLKKESGSSAWDSQAYSIESFVGGCFASGRPLQTDRALMFGLNTDPATDANYAGLDYAFYVRDNAQLEIYESGSKVWPSAGTVAYAAGDVLSVAYDGQTVRYFQNGTLRRAAVADALQRFYFDSSFYTVGGGALGDVAFGPAGGTGSKQVTRYKASVAPPSTPSGVAPSGWTLSIPTGPEAKWASTATISADDTLVLSSWSTPALITKPNARGAYAAGVTYYQFDSVTFNGGTYECLVASSLGNAPSGTAEANAYWSVIAAPGSPGEPGTPPSAFNATIDLSSSSTGVNLRTIADANGYTGSSDANITFEVESGVTITGLAGNGTPGGIAIDSGTWPVGSYSITLALVVKNGGKVYGGGGSITSGPGTDGGDAVYCRVPLSVTVNAGGELKSGGGGAGRGEGWLNFGTDAEGQYFETPYPGSSGGGGFPNGVGAANGTPSGGGAGAAGGSVGGGRSTGGGGNGGGAGAAGAAGSAATGSESARWAKWPFPLGAGGIAGYAVRKNGHTVPVTGTVVGTAA
ncbi:MAG: hypothetical protein ACK4X1_14380 [Terricaulis sp.]